MAGRGLGRSLLVSTIVLAGCHSTPSVPVPPARDLASICVQLEEDFRARLRPYPASSQEVEELEDTDVLVFLTDVSGPSPMDSETRTALRAYAERGGSILMLGFAANLAHEIGVEPRAPDRLGVYRWGVTDNTALGTYTYGFARDAATVDGLLAGLQPRVPDAWLLGGGELVSTQSCHWEAVDPDLGMVMGRLFRERDGVRRQLESVVLTFWPVGQGGVLAYGNLPEPWRPDVGENAREFLRNAVRSLHGGVPDSVEILVHSDPERAETLLAALPPAGQRRMPGAPLLPHWGWQVPLNYQRETPEPLTPAAVSEVILADAHRAGADLLSLQLADRERGYPFTWFQGDALTRPESWRGGAFWPEWNRGSLREIAAVGHQHGFLLGAYLEPGLTPEGSGVEALHASRWFAREFLDVRRFGAAALDMVGARSVNQGRDLRQVFSQYSPSFVGYDTGRASDSLGFVGTVHSDHGSPRGIHADGISRTWRAAYPPREYPLGVLDSRTRAAPQPTWQGRDGDGGGSYGDWILAQANDFVRPRIGIGAGLWWNSFNDRLMDEDTVEYVHGISMLPIKAAVAGRLSATGVGGYRDLVRGFVPVVQSGFGAQSRLPARTPFLQNNFIRLHGSAGPLQIDDTGRAMFPSDSTVPELGAFMQTRWRGFKYGFESEESYALDFIAGSRREAQGYGPSLLITADELGRGTFPSRLAYDAPGTWPRRVDLEFHVLKANYVLNLSLRGETGQGIVELRREGELLQLFSFEPGGEAQQYAIPLPMARGGQRSLSLEVVSGGSVAVEEFRLEPGANVLLSQNLPTESRALDLAGPIARQEEIVGTDFLNERRVYSTIADLPGFALTIEYEHMKTPGMEANRQFRLPGYRRVVAVSGEKDGQIRGGIVLGHDDPAQPDLMVVPIRMPRYHHLEFDETSGLSLVGYPSTKQRVDLGFLLLRDLTVGDEAIARRIFADLLDPETIRLDAEGRGKVAPNVSVPYPRVVKVVQGFPTPFRVREGGYWFHRGGQAAEDEDGGEWLHLYHVDEQPVQIESFDPATTTVVHPGPGSAGSVVLQEPTDHSVTVHLLQTGPLLSAPSVVLPVPFNAVSIDGVPWNYFDGEQVFLPGERGVYDVEVRSAIAIEPRLLRAGRSVKSCWFDASTNELVVQLAPGTGGTLWVSGNPVAVTGGELVPESENGYSSQDLQVALTRGAVVRVGGLEIRIRYR